MFCGPGGGSSLLARIASPGRWRKLVLIVVLLVGAQPAFAQTIPSHSPAPPGATGEAEFGDFQSRMDAVAAALREGDPKFKDMDKNHVQRLVEFVSGNMLFVLLHELGHAAITQMGLPVLGRMEDAADSFATLMLIRLGSDFSHRVLIDAAEGWFLADRQDRETGVAVAYYSEHGLNQQRAFQIVCLMVGSDIDKFRDLAEETKLPEARQVSCGGDFSNAAFSWDLLLEPHRRAADQPKTVIDVVYGPADGRAATAERIARSIRLLETVATLASDEWVWPAPLVLEMQACGFPNARWDLRTRTVTLCYELASEFADLYRDYAGR
jgi:hypothetical protein